MIQTSGMRELTADECAQVSGGFAATIAAFMLAVRLGTIAVMAAKAGMSIREYRRRNG